MKKRTGYTRIEKRISLLIYCVFCVCYCSSYIQGTKILRTFLGSMTLWLVLTIPKVCLRVKTWFKANFKWFGFKVGVRIGFRLQGCVYVLERERQSEKVRERLRESKRNPSEAVQDECTHNVFRASTDCQFVCIFSLACVRCRLKQLLIQREHQCTKSDVKPESRTTPDTRNVQVFHTCEQTQQIASQQMVVMPNRCNFCFIDAEFSECFECRL